MSDPTAFRKRNGQRVEPAAETRPYVRTDGAPATLRRWSIGPCRGCGATWSLWASTLYDGPDDQGKRRRCRWFELARCEACRAARRAAKGAT